jgi:hypothetical protein
VRGGGTDCRPLRAWLEYVIELAIDMLDALDEPFVDLEEEDAVE